MKRRSLLLLAVVASIGLWSPAPARATALITDVVDAFDDDDPFDLDLTATYHMTERRAKIVREFGVRTGSHPETGYTTPAHYGNRKEFRINNLIHALDLELEIGIFRDLELYGRLPIVLSDVNRLSFAAGVLPAAWGPTASEDDRCRAGVDPDNPTRSQQSSSLICDGFVDGPGSSYHKGLGDIAVGFQWGILNSERDVTKPTWVIGMEYIMPSGVNRDPTGALDAQHANTQAAPGGAGLGLHQLAWSMGLSKRLTWVEPYFVMNYRMGLVPRSAFSNDITVLPRCTADVANRDPDAAPDAQCIDPEVAEALQPGKLQPSHVGGITFGTEIVPYEVGGAVPKRFAIDLRAGVEYHSEGRVYTEMSDFLGELNYIEEYGHLFLMLGFYAQVYLFEVRLQASLGHDTQHFLTNEDAGRDVAAPPEGDSSGAPVKDGRIRDYWERNPDYAAYDRDGDRIRIQETTVFQTFATIGVNF